MVWMNLFAVVKESLDSKEVNKYVLSFTRVECEDIGYFGCKQFAKDWADDHNMIFVGFFAE